MLRITAVANSDASSDVSMPDGADPEIRFRGNTPDDLGDSGERVDTEPEPSGSSSESSSESSSDSSSSSGGDPLLDFHVRTHAYATITSDAEQDLYISHSNGTSTKMRLLDMAMQTATSYEQHWDICTAMAELSVLFANEKDIPWHQVINSGDDVPAIKSLEKELASMEHYGFYQITPEKHGDKAYCDALEQADLGRAILARKRAKADGVKPWKSRIVMRGDLAKHN